MRSARSLRLVLLGVALGAGFALQPHSGRALAAPASPRSLLGAIQKPNLADLTARATGLVTRVTSEAGKSATGLLGTVAPATAPVSSAIQRTVGSLPLVGPATGTLLGMRPQAAALLPPPGMAVDGPLDRVTDTPAVIGGGEGGAAAAVSPLSRLALDRDELGNEIVRGRVVLVDPPAALLARARARGFAVIGEDRDQELGLTVVTLGAPRGFTTRQALAALRRLAPGLEADYDHLYAPAGGRLAPSRVRAVGQSRPARIRIGMVDGGVAAHPALVGRVAEQKGFAGPARATGHGTAVASLLAGANGRFHGAASGASLFVADVYGGRRESGSATTIVRALEWLVSERPEVVNISLVGPPNGLLRHAIDAVRARGIAVVAAVGNDGPAAPPQYPASYPGVISVTAVDPGGAVLLEAGNAAHVDFGAPGADMAAARPRGGYARVRGTSFAAPLAAGRLAMAGSVDRLAREARPGKGRVGRGIVCAQCRIDPEAVGAR